MDIEIIRAEYKDIDSILEVMKEAYQFLEDKSWFSADDSNFIMNHIEKEGFILTALVNHIVIGFLIVRFPKEAMDNLGTYLDLTEDNMSKVVHMESVVVRKEYHGNKIQLGLMKEAEKRIQDTEYRYLFATVHPDNRYSLNNFISLDYNMISTVKKYGGLDRHILYKRIK